MAAHLGAGALRSRRIGIRQCLAEAAPAGMTEHDENLRRRGARFGPGAFSGSNLLVHHQSP